MLAPARRALCALALLAPAPAVRPADPGPAAPPPAVRILVLDLSVAGSAPKELGRALADVAAAEASRVGGFSVLSQGDVAAQLGVEKTRQMLGCTEDESCMLEIAGALAAERLLTGSVTLVDGTYLVAVKLVDARKARSLARVGDTLREPSQAELVDAVRRLAHEVLTGRKLDTTGVVRIEVDQPGAAVALDGRDLGLAPIAGGQRVPEGSHRITVQKAGFVTWESTVTVAAGTTVPVKAALVPILALERERRAFVELFAGFSPGSRYRTDGLTGCDTNCVGNLAGVRGGFLLGDRWSVEGFLVPYNVLRRTDVRTATVTIPWTSPAPTTATSSEYEQRSLVGTTHAGFSGAVRFFRRVPVTLRLWAGVAKGFVRAEGGGRFPGSPSGTYEHTVVEEEFWSWIAGPEVRVGWRLGRSFAIDAGIAALALSLPSAPAPSGAARQDPAVVLPDGPAFRGGVAWSFPVTAGVRWDL